MEVVANNYLPGDQHLVEKIVYELKSQGIFDQFRKECFADVDTKPAYQNLRQRVEGSVSSFLKDQRWKPDMNKNQVREMLRKKITESGFLETGVERIVDQVVNPKINTVFLPKVEEVVYSYLGVQKPTRAEMQKSEDPTDLLPTDLEAVSPDSETLDKTADKSSDTVPDLDGSNKTEDESPAFEPLEELPYVPQEENSVDSHLSGFSGLVSHESDQSLENKVIPMEQDSQMSHNSSESRISIVTSDETSKVDPCEDSSKSVKSESNSKLDEKSVDTTYDDKVYEKNDKSKYKSSDRHKSRSESKSEKDKSSKASKDLKSKHSSSSKDKEKSRDKKDPRDLSSKSSKSEKSKEKTDKDRSKSSKSSSSSNSSSSKEKQEKRDVSKSDKDRGKDKEKGKENDKEKERDKDKSRSSHSKSKDKSSDSKSKEKSSSSTDKYKHASSHSERHKKDKDKKKDEKTKSKDDHYSLKEKRNGRRSTDRDSNDGHSSKSNYHNSSGGNTSTHAQKTTQDSIQSTGNSGNLDQVESIKAAIDISDEVGDTEVVLKPSKPLKFFKPKCASNIQEAMRLIKIRKQLAKLEKHNQLSFATVDVSSSILLQSSIDLDKIKPNGLKSAKMKKERNIKNKAKNETHAENEKVEINVEEKSADVLLASNTVISQDSWDAMEAKLREEISSEFENLHEDDTNDSEQSETESSYAEKVDKWKKLEATEKLDEEASNSKKSSIVRVTRKRTIEDADFKNNADLVKTTETKKTKQLKVEVTNLKTDEVEKSADNRSMRKRKSEVTEPKSTTDNEKVTDIKNNNNNKKGKLAPKKVNKKINNVSDVSNGKFPLPLSPAESEKSVEPKIETVIPPVNLKRFNLLKNQRYSSDDLYKPRPSFGTSRRRGAKITEN